MWSEALDVPDERQLGWLLGGFWLVTRQTFALRRSGYWLGIGAAVAFAGWVGWQGWHGSPFNPATQGNRLRLTATMAALAGLPWLGRRRGLFGPVGAVAWSSVMRVAGCTAICALIFAISRVARFASARSVTGTPIALTSTQQVQLGALAVLAIALAVTIRAPQRDPASRVVAAIGGAMLLSLSPVVAVVTGYIAGVLALTTRRADTASAAVGLSAAAGAAAGVVVYSLLPAGHLTPAANPGLAAARGCLLVFAVVVLPVAVGFVAAHRLARHAQPAVHERARAVRATVAGAVLGAAGAVVLTALTVYTMALHPKQVSLERDGPNGPSHTAYEVEMSVGDAAQTYLLVLVLGPLIGAGLGATGNGLRGASSALRHDLMTPR